MALLDETDIEILHSLQKDAKINAKELSEKLHISRLLFTNESNV